MPREINGRLKIFMILMIDRRVNIMNNMKKELKKIKRYIDTLSNEELIKILNTSEEIGKYIGATKKNYEIDNYIKSKLINS